MPSGVGAKPKFGATILKSTLMIRLAWSLLFSLPLFLAAQENKYTNLVMEGAGIKGFAYVGALQMLDSLQMLDDLERVGGTSAGAIQATLLAVGYSPREIQDVIKEIPLKKFNDGSWILVGNFRRMRKQFGWYKGDQFEEWMARMIAAKTGDGNITFGELHRQKEDHHYLDLYITGTDITSQCLRVFSFEGYPDMRIKDAVRISISIPLYYKAVLMDEQGKVYDQPLPDNSLHVMSDGGVLGNYPLFLFDSTKYLDSERAGSNGPFENPYTLGIMVEMPEQIAYYDSHAGNYPMPIESVNDYVKALYHLLIDKSNPERNEGHRLHRTIMVSSLNLSGRVRRLSQQTVEDLVESGKEGVRRFVAGQVQK